jgi:hypothetical protein
VTRDEAQDWLARYCGMWRRELDGPTADTWLGVLSMREYDDALKALVEWAEEHQYAPSVFEFRSLYDRLRADRAREEQRIANESQREQRERQEELRRKMAREYSVRWAPIHRRLTHEFTSPKDPVRAAWLKRFPTGLVPASFNDAWTLLEELEQLHHDNPQPRRLARPRGPGNVPGFASMGGS